MDCPDYQLIHRTLGTTALETARPVLSEFGLIGAALRRFNDPQLDIKSFISDRHRNLAHALDQGVAPLSVNPTDSPPDAAEVPEMIGKAVENLDKLLFLSILLGDNVLDTVVNQVSEGYEVALTGDTAYVKNVLTQLGAGLGAGVVTTFERWLEPCASEEIAPLTRNFQLGDRRWPKFMYLDGIWHSDRVLGGVLHTPLIALIYALVVRPVDVTEHFKAIGVDRLVHSMAYVATLMWASMRAVVSADAQSDESSRVIWSFYDRLKSEVLSAPLLRQIDLINAFKAQVSQATQEGFQCYVLPMDS